MTRQMLLRNHGRGEPLRKRQTPHDGASRASRRRTGRKCRTSIQARTRTNHVILSVLFSQPAFVYGYIADVVPENARGYLVIAVAKTKRINFCVRIDKAVADDFSFESIVVQTNMAIRVWLTAVRNLDNTKITVATVACDSPTVNLKVFVGPDPGRINPEREYIAGDHAKAFSVIKLNTLFQQPYRDQFLTLHDFAEIAQRVKRSDSIRLPDLQEVLLSIYNQKQNIWDIEWLSDVDPSQVRASSYFIILHAIGHSFGLCDSDRYDGIEKNCDVSTVTDAASEMAAASIMNIALGLLYLTPDDVDGITSLFSRYGGY